MSVVRPRWEWRSFGRRFGEAAARLGRYPASAVEDSGEVYLIATGAENVKIRDGQIDVKVLRQVSADGLEQWMPTLKAPFPLGSADAAKVLQALHRPVPEQLHDDYALDAFLAAFAGPGSGVRIVPVHKRRVRYTIDGCLAELTDLRVQDTPLRTIAVEAEHPATVAGTVASLGLGGYANVSYPRALLACCDRRRPRPPR